MKSLATKNPLIQTLAAAALTLGILTTVAPAQDQPAREPSRRQGSDTGGQGGGPGGGSGGGSGGGGQRPDMQQIRKAMSDRLKESLGSSDDEWKVIEPQIEKVMTLARQSSPMMAMWGRGGRGRGPGGPGGTGGDNAGAPPAGGPQTGAPQPGGPRGPGDQPQSELAKVSQELSTLVADKSASNDAINAKITAFRAARDKARAELTAAQKELRELLSLRQEATLVSMGLLD